MHKAFSVFSVVVYCNTPLLKILTKTIFLCLCLSALLNDLSAQIPEGHYLGRNRVPDGTFDKGTHEVKGHYQACYYLDQIGGNVLQPGQYGIAPKHTALTKMRDHTTGAGDMLIACPSPTKSLLWTQLIPIEPLQQYRLSFWVASIKNSPTHFSFKVKSTTQEIELPKERFVWKEVVYFFETAEEANYVAISILSLNKNSQPALVAIDDISLQQIIPNEEKELARKNCFERIKDKKLAQQKTPPVDSLATLDTVAAPTPLLVTASPSTSILTEKESPASTIPPTIAVITKEDIVCGELLALPNIQYHDNSTRFQGVIAAKNTLFAIFDYMREHPTSTLTLYGHTDVFGKEENNLKLSKARVVKIQRWLTMNGIKESRISYEWFGNQHPLHPEGSIKNRRVEMKIACPE